jgi:hypothetical protein
MYIARQMAVLRYEFRMLGPLLFALPLLVTMSFAGLGLWLNVRNVNHSSIGSLLTANLEACIPLMVGVIIATIAAHDPAIELQLTVLMPYRFTVFRRFILLLAWTALVEIVAMLVLHAIFPWALSSAIVEGQLTWLSPLLWLTAVGALLALLMHSRSASGAVLGCIWVSQLAFHSYFVAYGWTQPWFLFATLYTPGASFWLTNRIELLLTALVVFIAIWWYLRNTEWRFRAEDV